MDSQQIEEEVEKNRRRFFRARSNTGALVAREGSHDGKLFILANYAMHCTVFASNMD